MSKDGAPLFVRELVPDPDDPGGTDRPPGSRWETDEEFRARVRRLLERPEN